MGCVVLGAPDSATMQLEPVVVGFRDIDEWVATETRGAFRPAVTRWTRHQWKEPVVRWKVAHTWRVGDDVMGGWHWDGCR